METLITILVNVIYAVLFFSAFAVLIGTTVLFAMAAWEKGVRPLLRRNAPDGDAPSK